MAERSGIHLTGADSGWPVGGDGEPNPKKDGSGTDGLPHAEAVTDGDVTATGEVQTVEQSVAGATGTTFTLTVVGQTTSGITLNASAATVKTALEALSNVAPGDVDVTGPAGGPYVITFLEGGAFGDTNVDAITGDGVGVNEIQTVTITGTPTGGTFTLSYNGQTTAAIAYNAAATAVRDALRALSNVNDADLTSGGGALPGTPVTITFTGTVAEQDVNAMTATGSLTGGTAPAVAVTTGTPGKAGPTIVVTTDAQGS